MAEFEIQEHTHDGLNTKKLDPRNFIGFPILTSVPTHQALEGTQVIVNSGGVSLYMMVGGTWTEVGGGERIEAYAFGKSGSTSSGSYLLMAGGVVGSSSAGYYIPRNKTIIEIAGQWNTDLTSGTLTIRRAGNSVLTKAMSSYSISETGLTTSFLGEGTLQVSLDSLSGAVTDPQIIIFLQDS